MDAYVCGSMGDLKKWKTSSYEYVYTYSNQGSNFCANLRVCSCEIAWICGTLTYILGQNLQKTLGNTHAYGIGTEIGAKFGCPDYNIL